MSQVVEWLVGWNQVVEWRVEPSGRVTDGLEPSGVLGLVVRVDGMISRYGQAASESELMRLR